MAIYTALKGIEIPAKTLQLLFSKKNESPCQKRKKKRV